MDDNIDDFLNSVKEKIFKKDETITKEEYDDWRYHYPDNTPGWSKINPEIFTQNEIKKMTEPTEKED